MQHLSKDLKHTIYGHATDDALMRLMCVSKSDNAIAAGVLAMRAEIMKPAEAMFVEMLNKLHEKYRWGCYFVKPGEIRVEYIKNSVQWYNKLYCKLYIELKKPGFIEVSMSKTLMKPLRSGRSIHLGSNAWTKTFFPHAKSASICFEETHTHPYPSDPVAEVCETFDADEESESSEQSSDESDSE